MSAVSHRWPRAAIWACGLGLILFGWLRSVAEPARVPQSPEEMGGGDSVQAALARPLEDARPDRLSAEAVIAAWAVARGPASLWAAPHRDEPVSDPLPFESYVAVLGAEAEWVEVAFAGAGGGAAPAIGWASGLELEPLAHRPTWAKNYRDAPLWAGAERESPLAAVLPPWSWLELTGEERGGRFAVRVPGDGREVAPGRGWIDAPVLVPSVEPDAAEVPRGYPASAEPDTLRLPVPYRSQLDDTPWASANCGPTTLSMGLEFLGKPVDSGSLRKLVLDAQKLWGDHVGVYIWALAAVAERYGFRALDLSTDGVQRRWTTDHIRVHLEQGHPVILQVAYRALPGREAALYGGDHYIIVIGATADGFLYHDSIDSDGVGYDRIMTEAELERAMRATDRPYAYAGFALADG